MLDGEGSSSSSTSGAGERHQQRDALRIAESWCG